MLSSQAVTLGAVLLVWLGGHQAQKDGGIVPSSLSLPSSLEKQSDVSPQALEQAIYAQINQYRQQRRLPPLTLDERISQQARSHSQAMAQQGRINHDGFGDRLRAINQVIPYSSGAENVAYNRGFSDPATRAVQGWLTSTGHRQNIEGQFNVTGIGVAKNSRGEYYFTQIFIRRR
ncbi:MAG TPA: CAP domain-containing protein [Crinalium sp.]|jgi:uncharacterized protein YkwD